MSLYDYEWLEQSLHDREDTVRASLRPASLEEMRSVGNSWFPIVSDPWYGKFHRFLDHHPGEKYYLAEASGGACLAYCHGLRTGMWFVPGGGMGIIQPRGIAKLAAMVEKM